MEQPAWKNELLEIARIKNSVSISNVALVKELDALLNAQDEVVALLYSRRGLEVIITELCVDKLNRERGSEPLNALIDRIVKEKIIPEYIHTAMQNLNRITTYGAHPKEFDPRQVRTAIIEFNTVLDWYCNEKKYEPITVQKVEESVVKPNTEAEMVSVPVVDNKDKPKVKKTEAVIEKKEKNSNTTEKDKPSHKLIIIAGVAVAVGIIIGIWFAVFHKDEITQTHITPKELAIPAKEQKADKPPDVVKTTIKIDSNVAKPLAVTSITMSAAASIQQATKKPELTQSKPVAVIDKPVDIKTLLQQVCNNAAPFAERKKASEKALVVFAPKAYINILVNNQVVDRTAVPDYLNRLLTLKNIQVSIEKTEYSPEGKIKVLDVTEMRK